MHLTLPPRVNYIIDVLESRGFEAYAVGGCVRDSILAQKPKDWDITTSAKPEEVKACFRRTIDTGIQHGTVTVMLDDEGFEVTTYRIDGDYTDGRHPDQVMFTPNLRDDLMRRDFTINAMAYNPRSGLVDLYGGVEDLSRKIIRCVGDPDARFTEDALRIMRAVRFAARFGFRIEEATWQAIEHHTEKLSCVSAERIREELVKTLVSPHPEYVEALWRLGMTAVILPEFDRCMEEDEGSGVPGPEDASGSPVGLCCIRAMCGVPPRPELRLALLLSGLGRTGDRGEENGAGLHFPNYAEEAAECADEVLRRLRFDNHTRKAVVNLIRCQGLKPAPDEAEVRTAMAAAGPECFEDLLMVQRALLAAGVSKDTGERLEAVGRLGLRILERGDCLAVRDLAVGGTELKALGISGPEIGLTLKAALREVLRDPALNTKEALCAFAAERHRCTLRGQRSSE